MGKYKGITAASRSSTRIEFTLGEHKGLREIVKIIPDDEGQKLCYNIKIAIEADFALGKLNYAKYFPHSENRFLFSDLVGETLTVNELLDRYKKSHYFLNRAPSSQETYSRDIETIRNALGKCIVTELKLPQVIQMLNAEENPRSKERGNNMIIPLRKAFLLAKESGWIENNIFSDWGFTSTKKKVVKPKYDIFSAEEQQAMCEVLHPQIANYFMYCCWTGTSPAETIPLLWSDIDFDNKIISINKTEVKGNLRRGEGKTEFRIRDINMNSMAEKALRDQMEHTYLKRGYVFHNPRIDDKWQSARAINKQLTNGMIKAGIPVRKPYMTRHTFCSTMAPHVQEKWLIDQMGHSNSGMIRAVYNQLDKRRMGNPGEAAVQALKNKT